MQLNSVYLGLISMALRALVAVGYESGQKCDCCTTRQCQLSFVVMLTKEGILHDAVTE